MRSIKNAKCKMQNSFVGGIVDSSPAARFLILHFAFLIDMARRNG
jgi:hypothetical protein